MRTVDDPEVSERRRYLKNPARRWLGNVLLLAGLALIGAVSLGDQLVAMEATPFAPSPRSTPVRLTPSPVPTPDAIIQTAEKTTEPQATAERMPPPTRLEIPTLNLDAPVVELPIQDKTWDMSALTGEIAHLGGTANPGEASNMVLAGHVTLRIGAGPFLHLERLQAGDLAVVYAGEEPYTYQVIRKKYVPPDDVSVAYPSSLPTLTMLTCTRWDEQNRSYTERVAVIARLVTEEIPDWTRSRISRMDQ